MAGARSRSGGARSSGAARERDGRTPNQRTRAQASRSASRSAPQEADAGTGRRVAGTALRAAGNATKFAVKNIGVPVASAAAGAVVGSALEQRRARRGRKILGISLPRPRTGANGLAKSVGEAGKQFGRLADEVRQTREKVEQVGKALS